MRWQLQAFGWISWKKNTHGRSTDINKKLRMKLKLVLFIFDSSYRKHNYHCHHFGRKVENSSIFSKNKTETIVSKHKWIVSHGSNFFGTVRSQHINFFGGKIWWLIEIIRRGSMYWIKYNFFFILVHITNPKLLRLKLVGLIWFVRSQHNNRGHHKKLKYTFYNIKLRDPFANRKPDYLSFISCPKFKEPKNPKKPWR